MTRSGLVTVGFRHHAGECRGVGCAWLIAWLYALSPQKDCAPHPLTFSSPPPPVMSAAPLVVDAIKTGKLEHIFLIGG